MDKEDAEEEEEEEEEMKTIKQEMMKDEMSISDISMDRGGPADDSEKEEDEVFFSSQGG